jgi:cephalosporin hydroxylase
MTYTTKAIRVARTILRTSLSSLQLARGACRSGGANQHWSELSGLVHLVRDLRPAAIMEIGMDLGGTMTLWAQIAQSNAHLIGLDIKISPQVDGRVRAKLQPQQNLSLVESNSHEAATRRRVVDTLGNTKLDFLFIDGDHSYEGVKQDFEDYSSLVRTGGLVGFHDIVPDFTTRFGIQTGSQSGGVYKFWREISSRFPHYEFIESVAQDGYGIGVVRV